MWSYLVHNNHKKQLQQAVRGRQGLSGARQNWCIPRSERAAAEDVIKFEQQWWRAHTNGASVPPDWSRSALFHEKAHNGKCIFQVLLSARRKESKTIKFHHISLLLDRVSISKTNGGQLPCPCPEFQPRIHSEVWCQQWPFLKGFCGRYDCTTEQKTSRHTNTVSTPWQRSHQLTWHRCGRWLFHPRPRCCQRPSCFESPRLSLCSRCPCTHRNSYSRQWFDLWRNVRVISCLWLVGVCRKLTCVLNLPLHRDADGHLVTLTLRLHHIVRF